MTAFVRPLSLADAVAFRTLRLAALREAPEAFGSSYEEETARPLSDFADRLSAPEPSLTFGAFVGGALCGIAGFRRESGLKTRHIGLLWGVYVAPTQRGTGLAKALVESVIAHARRHIVILHADVGADNHAARRLYEGLGFRCYGVQPKALLVDGRFIDEALLALDFSA